MKTRIQDGRGYGEKTVTIYKTEAPDDVAALAMHFLDRWSLVTAVPDGEDSAGRAKHRLPTPDEVVTRAFDIAEKAYEVARSRGHMISVPDLNEINADVDARHAEDRAEEAKRRDAKRAQAAA